MGFKFTKKSSSLIYWDLFFENEIELYEGLRERVG